MEYKIYLIILFIYFIQLFQINGQSNKCSEVQSPKTYSECKVHDSLSTSTICCLIKGVYGGNNGTACIPVDSLFSNKTVTLTSNGNTGTMICGETTSSSSYIYINKTILITIIFMFFSI